MSAAIQELKKLLSEATTEEVKAALTADIERLETSIKAEAQAFMANLEQHIKDESRAIFERIKSYL